MVNLFFQSIQFCLLFILLGVFKLVFEYLFIYNYFLCYESVALDGFSLFGSANRNQECVWKTKEGL